MTLQDDNCAEFKNRHTNKIVGITFLHIQVIMLFFANYLLVHPPKVF